MLLICSLRNMPVLSLSLLILITLMHATRRETKNMPSLKAYLREVIIRNRRKRKKRDECVKGYAEKSRAEMQIKAMML